MTDGFYNEIHPKLRPVETVIDGVFIAGCAQGPKNLSESVASTLSGVSKAAAMLLKGYVDLEPLVAANGALAMDTKAVVVLQGEGVTVAKKGAADGLVAPGFPPLADLIKNLFEFGGELLLCTPCLESRNISDDEIIEGAVKVKTGRVITEVLDAKSTLNY